MSIVHGNRDRLVPYENMQYLQEQLKSVSSLDTLTLSNADHFIPWTHYPQVKDALLKILQLP